jgi:hypothetical protein
MFLPELLIETYHERKVLDRSRAWYHYRSDQNAVSQGTIVLHFVE